MPWIWSAMCPYPGHIFVYPRSNPELIMGQKQTRNVANIIPAYLGQSVGFFWRHTAAKTGAVSGTIQFRQTLASIWYKIGPIRNPQMGKNIMPALPSG